MNNEVNNQIKSAIESGNAEQFETLLEKLPDESIDGDIWSDWLCECIADGDFPRVDMLCKLNEKDKIHYPQRYNLYCSDYIQVCVMHAAVQEGTKIMRRILDCGFDVDAHDEEGNCALSMATEAEDEEMIKLLLEYGADPDMAHPYGEDDEDSEY